MKYQEAPLIIVLLSKIIFSFNFKNKINYCISYLIYFTQIFQHFTENVSVKGVPKIVKANNPCLKCLWVIAVLLGLVIGLWQIIPLVSSYLHYTTSLATMEVRNENGFPGNFH